MKRIIEGRGTGKTYRLLQHAKEIGAIFVCSDPRAMRDKAYSYGITGIDFMSYYDFFERGREPKNYVIDELEPFVNFAFQRCASGGTLAGYTLSIEV